MQILPAIAAASLAACAGCAHMSASRDSDVRALLRLHAEMIDAHFDGDANRFLGFWSDDFLLVNRGARRTVAPSEMKAGFEDYLGSIEWEYYRDRKPPVVEVSASGDLAWLAAEVEAKGVKRNTDGSNESIEFQSAWVSLFRQNDGEWVMVGNASNFAE